MSQEDQDALAAQWEAELAKESDAAGDSGGTAEAAAPTATPPAGDDAQRQADEMVAAQWAANMAQEEESHAHQSFGGAGAGMGGHATEAHFKDMTEMARQPADNKLKRELDFILDIPLDVSAELGRTRLLINELLQLGQGSVVELNKLAGEPLEVYVNGKLVARGEAVVINEKFGVRLTDIISPIERVKQLG